MRVLVREAPRSWSSEKCHRAADNSKVEFTAPIAELECHATRLSDAIAAHGAGDLSRAKLLYEDLLRVDPRQPDALQMLGLLAQQTGDLVRARALIEASLSIKPDVAQAHYNLGVTCGLQGDINATLVAYETAIQLLPDFAEAHNNLGNLCKQIGRPDAALRAFSAAIRAKPDFAAAYCNLATVLIDLKRYELAIRALETALVFAPEMPEAHLNLGEAYRRSGRFREALTAMQRALELRPDRIAYLNLAFAANQIEAFDIAENANRRALELEAASADGQCNLAWEHLVAGRYAEAIVASEAAIALRPNDAKAHVNLAFSLLVRGEFARGWDEYAWMWRLPTKRAVYSYLDRLPLWNGESFDGRRLLVTRDQGFGDAIQMVRYLPAIKARGGQVVLETPRVLVSLFDVLRDVDAFCVTEDASRLEDGIDLVVPLSGLPRIFDTDLNSIPGPIPYLRAHEERVSRWRPRMQSATGLRVGIVWAGNPNHENDHNRSAGLADFAALGAIDGITWFGLQKGLDEERRSCGSLNLEPIGTEIEDFADTAAILTQLDLVIAVDTSIVHLAGAMGKPVWTLLAYVADYRWLLERDDTPWYPTMRLFRQTRAGDWTSIFAHVARELQAQVLKTTDGRQYAARLACSEQTAGNCLSHMSGTQ